MQTEKTEQTHEKNTTGSRRLRTIGLILLGLVAATIILGVAAYLGWQNGQADRAAEAENALRAQLDRQLILAQTDLQNGNISLAAARTDWALENAPQNATAVALRASIDDALRSTQPTTPTPTPTPSPTPEPAVSADDLAQALAYLQQLVSTEAWDEAVTAVTAFQVEHPDFQRETTDNLLFEAYLNLGMELAWSDRIELALTYLEQAQRLGTLPQVALDQQALSKLYLDGLSYYGVRWEVAIPNFQQICDVTPFYLDSCERLLTAKILYGDQWAFADDYCPAASWYADAILTENTPELAAKLSDARTKCAEATPIPEPTPEVPEGTDGSESPEAPTPTPEP